MSEDRVHTSLTDLPDLLSRAGASRVLIITGQSQRYVERVRDLLANFQVGVFAGAQRHVPEEVVSDALRAFDVERPHAILALGGGSAIGLCKALRLERQAYFVAVPTTYSGSEQTSIHGVRKQGVKVTGRDERVRPDAVVYDVDLTLDMPKLLTVTSLMNALAHPLSAFMAAGAGTTGQEIALEAIHSVYTALGALVDNPRSREGRALALRGAGQAAQVLESQTLGPHHKLVHRLGGRFDVDHSALHSVILPHSVHRLRSDAPEALGRVERHLSLEDLEARLFDLLVGAGARTSLESLGIDEAGFSSWLEAEPDLPRELLRLAFQGCRPSAR
jgi:alcohol dehydrogenase class IV